MRTIPTSPEQPLVFRVVLREPFPVPVASQARVASRVQEVSAAGAVPWVLDSLDQADQEPAFPVVARPVSDQGGREDQVPGDQVRDACRAAG